MLLFTAWTQAAQQQQQLAVSIRRVSSAVTVHNKWSISNTANKDNVQAAVGSNASLAKVR
jgi:hypothetical protein